MVPAARWMLAAAVALGVVAAPALVRAIPPDESSVGAATLARRVLDSRDRGWSGEVATLGSIEVPVEGSVLAGVARLLGERTDLRVWWRDSTRWRVDRIRASGETDLVRDGGLMVRWTYEGQRVRFTPYSAVRLPGDSDVVPVELANRLLAGVRPDELERLPSRRIAGRSAAGIRFEPRDTRSTIGRVDVWADPGSGVPLRVDVYGRGDARPALTTQLLSFDLGTPSREDTGFELSEQLDFSRGVALDDAAGANAFAPFVPPGSAAGLPRRGRSSDYGAVGVYGRGATALVAIPLRDVVARGLRDQLRESARSREAGERIALEVGPISVLLARVGHGTFLVMGTVTPETLQQAADDLEAGVRQRDR